jgi:glucose-6-phosphate 1-dehydrogenase
VPSDRQRTVVVLGGGGALATSLLLPGLARVLSEDDDRDVRLIGAGIEEVPDWRARVASAFARFPTSRATARAVAGSAYIRADATDPAGLRAVLAPCRGDIVLYFALPPAVTAAALAALGRVGVPPGVTLAVEKPVGTDLASARAVNAHLGALVPPERAHRVDHFLALPAFADLMALRDTDAHARAWLSGDRIARVELTFDETVAVDGRADFYDRTGAICDMHQSHLLQALGLILAESVVRPADPRAGAVIADLLPRVRLAGPLQRAVLAGRYTRGRVGERDIPDYVAEPGVDPARRTETFAALTVTADLPGWREAELILRSGKAISAPRQEIRIHLRPTGATWTIDGIPLRPNTLRVNAPDSTITVTGVVEGSGRHTVCRLPSSGESMFVGYARVVRALLDRTGSYAVHPRAAEEGWRIVEPAVEAIRSGRVPLHAYAAGSAGPVPTGVPDR